MPLLLRPVTPVPLALLVPPDELVFVPPRALLAVGLPIDESDDMDEFRGWVSGGVRPPSNYTERKYESRKHERTKTRNRKTKSVFCCLSGFIRVFVLSCFRDSIPPLLQQRQHELRQLIGILQYLGAGLFQHLALGEVGRLRGEIGI